MSYKGKFRPKNKNKYRGDCSKIIYRSSWELKMMRWLDENPDVIYWQSEEVAIPYISPKDNKIHRYFPDFIFEIKKEERRQTYLVEVKPEKQMAPPNPSKRNATPSGRVSRRYLREAATFAINDAKWEAAKKYCEQKGWIFKIWGESALGIK